MGLVEIVESAVRCNEWMLKIRCVDTDAPDEPVLRERISKIAFCTGKRMEDVAGEIYAGIAGQGKTAEEVISEMEERIS